MTLFAFDVGQGLSEHTAPFDAFAQVLEGEVEITIAGKAHILQGGEMILMPAGHPTMTTIAANHAMSAPSDGRILACSQL